MKSRTTRRFRRQLQALRPEIRRKAKKAYRNFKRDPKHPGLQFKKIHPSRPIYSARIDIDHRAAGLLEKETVIRFLVDGSAQSSAP